MKLNERAFGLVVIFLGVALLMCLGFIGVLALQEQGVPDELKVASGSLVTGLLGLLAKTPLQQPADD